MYMDRPRQRIECSGQQQWPCHYGLASFLGVSFFLLFTGCAQLDQSTAQDKDSAAKQATKKKADGSPTPGVVKEPPQRAPSTTTAKQADQEKVLGEKKEKKSHVASDKKPKKLPKSQTESQLPTEDVFLSPVPLPSKPASIGGSGG